MLEELKATEKVLKFKDSFLAGSRYPRNEARCSNNFILNPLYMLNYDMFNKYFHF